MIDVAEVVRIATDDAARRATLHAAEQVAHAAQSLQSAVATLQREHLDQTAATINSALQSFLRELGDVGTLIRGLNDAVPGAEDEPEDNE